MNDFAFVAIIFAFFGLAALFVAARDRIIGPEEAAGLDPATAATPATAAAAAAAAATPAAATAATGQGSKA